MTRSPQRGRPALLSVSAAWALGEAWLYLLNGREPRHYGKGVLAAGANFVGFYLFALLLTT